MFFFGDIVHLCYFAKKSNQYLCHIGIYPWFFLRFFLTKKHGAMWGPKKPQKGPPRVSFEADNLKFLDSIKVFDGLNQKQKDTASPVNVTVFFFPQKGVVFFWRGSRDGWKASNRLKGSRFKILSIYIFIHMYIIYIYVFDWFVTISHYPDFLGLLCSPTFMVGLITSV